MESLASVSASPSREFVSECQLVNDGKSTDLGRRAVHWGVAYDPATGAFSDRGFNGET
jgi:hypothetical protein